jgi:hypothetical protein
MAAAPVPFACLSIPAPSDLIRPVAFVLVRLFLINPADQSASTRRVYGVHGVDDFPPI